MQLILFEKMDSESQFDMENMTPFHFMKKPGQDKNWSFKSQVLAPAPQRRVPEGEEDEIVDSVRVLFV